MQRALKEAVDVVRKVFVRLDAALVKRSIVGWKIRSPSGAMTLVIMVAGGSTACTAAESTTINLTVVLVGRHVGATASKTREVDAYTDASNSKSVSGTLTVAGPLRSAQIRGAVSCYLGSLIRKSCMYVRCVCVDVVCCSENCARVTTGPVIRRL
jgi:hypothetical protein